MELQRRNSLGFGIARQYKWRPKPAKPGEDHPRATLTNEQVREIWNLRCQVSQGVVARRYNTQQSTISRIWHRKAWTTVTDGAPVGVWSRSDGGEKHVHD